MQIEGILKSVTYRHPENGFSVLRFEIPGERGTAAVTGIFPEISAGESFRMEGEWKVHPKYGRQFLCAKCEQILPTGGEGLIAYLASGAFKGIGKTTAARIVEVFGEHTLEILDSGEDISGKVKGLSGKRLEKFLASWREQRESRGTMLFLYSHGITGSTALRLWGKYGKTTEGVITQDPYILCEEVWGIGFLKADEIADKVGISKTSAERLRAALRYTLTKAADGDGHTYLPETELLKETSRILKMDTADDDSATALIDNLKYLLDSNTLERQNGGIWIPQLYRAEQLIAGFIRGRTEAQAEHAAGLEELLKNYEREQKIEYDPVQFKAICGAVESPIFIVTGGPGTGKTTILKGVLHLADKLKKTVLLAAPTGRAARRMGEVTGHGASTLHRLLEIDPVSRKFKRGAEEPLDADILIVDEFSMVDTWLCAGLIRAIPGKMSLVIIGDKDQLPSVGPGNVLRDFLQCKCIPGIRLTHLFRQSGGNDIAEKAHKINEGHRPAPIEGPHFHFRDFQTPEECLGILQELVLTGVKGKIDIDISRDLQVLTPMHKGPLGTDALNEFLQKLLNPKAGGFALFGTHWKAGDRVMQLKNNYEKEVFNGDVGTVKKVKAEDQFLEVDFDGRNIPFSGLELDQMNLAYACTIHKSQGSEYPAVIIILDSSHYRMLQRNLIYTAVTRAKGHVWVLSSPGAFDTAVRNNRTVHRYTMLAHSISQSIGTENGGTCTAQTQTNDTDEFMDILNSL